MTLGSTSTSVFGRQLRQVVGTNVSTNSALSSAQLRDPIVVWWKAIIQRLDELCSLPRGWDGYAAPPVSFSNASFAASVLASASPLDSPAPEIVPGPSGDLQIEWHTEFADIELHISNPYDVTAWRATQSTGIQGEEVRLKADYSVVAGWLVEMSEAAIAARPTAA